MYKRNIELIKKQINDFQEKERKSLKDLLHFITLQAQYDAQQIREKKRAELAGRVAEATKQLQAKNEAIMKQQAKEQEERNEAILRAYDQELAKIQAAQEEEDNAIDSKYEDDVKIALSKLHETYGIEVSEQEQPKNELQ